MTSNTQSKSLVSVSLVCLSLAGCALNSSGPAATNVTAGGTGISGTLFGGQQPVLNSTVTVYAAGTTDYGSAATLLGTTVSDTHGNFQFASNAITCPQANTPVYIVATGGNSGSGNNANLVEAAGLGACSDALNATVQINEVSTVATAFALAQFFATNNGVDSFGGPSSKVGSTVTYSKGLSMANAVTIPTLLNLAGGVPQVSTTATTVDDLKMRTIANIIASCVNSTGLSGTSSNTPCDSLFNATQYGTGPRPTNTLEAAVNIAKYPFSKVSNLLNLSTGAGPFGPGVASVNDWTIAIQYSTPAVGLSLAANTTSNLDIDAAGNVWLPVTLSSTTGGVAMFNPATHSFSTFKQTGMVQPQNLAISNAGNVYVSDQGSKYLSAFTATGSSGGQFNSGGTSQTSVAIGPNDQIWLSATNGAAYTLTELQGGLLSGTVTNLLGGVTKYPVTSLTTTPTNDVYSATFGGGNEYLENYNASITVGVGGINTGLLAVDTVVTNFGATGAGAVSRNNATQAKTTLITTTTPVNNTFCITGNSCATKAQAGMSLPTGLATDGANNVWTANSQSGSVSVSLGSAGGFGQLSAIAYHSSATAPQLPAPAGIGMDASGNVWVSNVTTAGNPYVLTELVGAAAPTITPLAAQISGGTYLVGTKPTN